jgi:NAD-dependent SIR2 family protein deacetylase
MTPQLARPYTERIEKARRVLSEADCLLIGAGAGLSTAAGLTYKGLRFTDNFADFISRYGMSDMYSSSFYDFDTEEEYWAYWALHIGINRFDPPALPLYAELRELAEGLDHFVITTNVDHQFFKSGFDPVRVFAVQGDYGNLQCAVGCHQRLYDDEGLVASMRSAIDRCRIPSELVPHCPVCGGPMDVNLRKNRYFVQDESWYFAQQRYDDYLSHAANRKLVLLEIGVGYNTPGIIRYPFERILQLRPRTTLIRINPSDLQGLAENAAQTIPFGEDTASTISLLLPASIGVNNG